MKRNIRNKNSPILLGLIGFVCVILPLLYLAVSNDEDTLNNNNGGVSADNRPPYTPPKSPDPKAKDPAAHYLTKLYCAALANPNQVPEFVRRNHAAFENVEDIRRCAANFRQLVIQEVLKSPSRDDYYKAGMKIAGSNPDLIRIAGEAADDLASGSADLMALSFYLVELADSLDGMLRNDDRAYHGTQVYQLFAFVRGTIDQWGGSQVLGPKYWTFVSQLSYECLYPLVAKAS